MLSARKKSENKILIPSCNQSLIFIWAVGWVFQPNNIKSGYALIATRYDNTTEVYNYGFLQEKSGSNYAPKVVKNIPLLCKKQIQLISRRLFKI